MRSAPRRRLSPAARAAGLALAAASACVLPLMEEPYVDHEEASDLDEVDGLSADGVGSTFDRHEVLSDSFFRDTAMVDAAGMQAFLEATPYGRSWLAGYSVGGLRAAAAIVEAARGEGLNPVVLLARMQVEKTLVSPSTAPSASSIAFAMGCGCPDGRACDERYRGFANQLACSARTLRRHYDGSADGSGAWRRGLARRSLDGLTVTPRNHATASLYAYTPWVLVGRGGNWLVWNVTRRFHLHMVHLGVARPGGSGGGEPVEGGAECWVSAVAGSCIHVDDCPEVTHFTTRGLCPGSSAIRCCTPVTCQTDGRRGECRHVASCDEATHETVSGLCPGSSEIRCCLPLY